MNVSGRRFECARHRPLQYCARERLARAALHDQALIKPAIG